MVKNWRIFLIISAVLMSMTACGDDPAVALTCDDILPADQANFSDLAQHMRMTCAQCHTKSSPVYGYDFSTPGVTYDSTAYKPRMVYFQLAAGTMPPGGENQPECADSNDSPDSVRWCEDKLKLFRSWYCHGALYE